MSAKKVDLAENMETVATARLPQNNDCARAKNLVQTVSPPIPNLITRKNILSQSRALRCHQPCPPKGHSPWLSHSKVYRLNRDNRNLRVVGDSIEEGRSVTGKSLWTAI